MTRPVWYMAHPLRPTEAEMAVFQVGADRFRLALDQNLRRAQRWLTWLRRTFPSVTFVAPWIASVLAGDDDADPAQREAGIADALALIPLLSGVVHVGGRVSSGMTSEASAARRVVDLTGLGAEPRRVVTPEPSIVSLFHELSLEAG